MNFHVTKVNLNQDPPIGDEVIMQRCLEYACIIIVSLSKPLASTKMLVSR